MSFRWTQTDSDQAPALFDADELVERNFGTGEFLSLEFLQVRAKSILNRVPESSAMPFKWTINPYRGCSHACTYCFARPSHQYLNLDTGDGFDSQIVVKINAPEVARAELTRPGWAKEKVAFGTNTDPYQRCEGKFHLMRGLLRALIDSGTPFSILTKSTLILRDIDLLVEARDSVGVSVMLSVPTLDSAVWKATEPGTPHPLRRIDAVARLNETGIRCGILMAPILPGLSDSLASLRDVVEAGLDAGAVHIGANLLYLHPIVRSHYLSTLSSSMPDIAQRTDELFGQKSTLANYKIVALRSRIEELVNDGLKRRGRPPQLGAEEYEEELPAPKQGASSQERTVAPPAQGSFVFDFEPQQLATANR